MLTWGVSGSFEYNQQHHGNLIEHDKLNEGNIFFYMLTLPNV